MAESFLAQYKLKFKNDYSDFSYPTLKIHHQKIAEMTNMDKNVVSFILQSIFNEISNIIASS